MQPPYPEHWEADVVLADGGIVHLRPIRADDADLLVDFYSKVSDESKYLRFFAPHPTLSPSDVERFTNVDYVDRVALIALVGDGMIAIVRYDRVDEYGRVARSDASDRAEIAFLIQDAHQGRGLGSALLEHIAQVARESGVTRFVAEVLPGNIKMLRVFQDAGYEAHRGMADGVVHLTIDLAPTDTSLAVMRSREQRAEARSVGRLLRPRSVAVVGTSSDSPAVAQALLRHLHDGDFQGASYAVGLATDDVADVPAYPAIRSVPEPIDVAIVAVSSDAMLDVVQQCADKGVLGLVIASSGYAETGPDGRERQRQLVRAARAGGMRVIGPSSFGLINTDPEVSLNASLSPVMPERGRAGFFSQSGTLGIAILESAVQRGLGVSTFVSAGNRADVSGNDLLQFWEEDSATDAILLYLESIGNPRKFARLSRRIARSKPIIAVKSGRHSQGVPLGHAVQVSPTPPAAVDAMFEQSGVVRVDTLAELFDVAQVLTYQPFPAGPRVAVVGNSNALELLAVDACTEAGLDVMSGTPALDEGAAAEDFATALASVLEDASVDSVVVVFVPPLGTTGEAVATVLGQAGARQIKTVVSTFLGTRGVPPQLRLARADGGPAMGWVPSYPTPEQAVKALAAATSYAAWRRRPTGVVPEFADVNSTSARDSIENAMRAMPDGGVLPASVLAELLGCYGITVLPSVQVSSSAEALSAAEQLGYPLVLKTLAPAFRHRPDLGSVRLGIETPSELAAAYVSMSVQLGALAMSHLVVQPMAAPGVACELQTIEDPLFGPIVSFGIAGVATELLGDRAYRIPPLTTYDASVLVRSVRATPLLFGHRGAEPVDVPALEDLVLRIGRLADECPELASLRLNPVVVAAEGKGLTVVTAEARIAPPAARADLGPRRLSR